MDGVIRSIVKHSCASLGPILRGLLDNFRAGLNKSVNEVFCAGSIGPPSHADTAIDGVTVCFSEGAASVH